MLLRRAVLARAAQLDGDRGFGPLLKGAAVTTIDCSDLVPPGDVDQREDLVSIADELARRRRAGAP